MTEAAVVSGRPPWRLRPDEETRATLLLAVVLADAPGAEQVTAR